jgi:hypothetical protein
VQELQIIDDNIGHAAAAEEEEEEEEAGDLKEYHQADSTTGYIT